jgi:soluble lytic murein transglycosylase-like protein
MGVPLIAKILYYILLFFVGLAFGYTVGETLFTPVRADSASRVEEIIKFNAAKHNFDPLLIKAIIVVESRGNPRTVGKHGEIGLMQVHPKWHPLVSFDVQKNIEVGVEHLAYVREKCRKRYPELTYIVCYNNGHNRTVKHPHLHPYYKNVMTVYEHLTNGKK